MIVCEILNLILVKFNLIDKWVNFIKNVLFIFLNRVGIYCNFMKNEIFLIEYEIVFVICLYVFIIMVSFIVKNKVLLYFILNNIYVCVNYFGDFN